MATKKKAVKKTGKKATKKTAKRRSSVSTASLVNSQSNKVRMKVVGIGGAGGNVIMRMDEGVRGVGFWAINTDVQDLMKNPVRNKIHIGKILTRGMGAGMNPELGKLAAEESRLEIAEALKDTDLVFLAAGFGGGTGSGAAPIVAEVARELGILTVGVVTKPFAFEGAERMRIAEEAITRIKDKVDALLVIPNDKIFGIIDVETPMLKAFDKIDEILKSAVHGITEMVSSSGIINVDFADLRAVIAGAGSAVIGVGVASGKERAVKATNEAINSPLLETSINGARGLVFCVAANRDLKMVEIDEAAKAITSAVDPGAKIIFGAYNDRKLKPGQLKVVIIAAGFDGRPSNNSSSSLFNLGNLGGEVDDEMLDNDSHENTSRKEEVIDEEQEDVEEDDWDIPAFLRKRKKK